MNIFFRLTLTYAMSLAVGGAVQQTIMTASGDFEPSVALPPLAAIVLLITVVFGIVVWWRPTTAVVHRTAASTLAIMLIFGVTVYIAGASTRSPGIGGNIGYGLALIVDFYFLLPAAAAVPVHWLMLRAIAGAATAR